MAGRTILVGGGSGFIGKRLVKLLSTSGYNVTVISRMPGLNRITWHDLESMGLPKTTAAIVNLTGQNVLDPSRRWSPGFKQNVWNSRINSTASIVRAIKKSDPSPEVFINICGVSGYRFDTKKIYSEDDPAEGYDFMSKLCVAWEKAANELDEQSDKCRLVKIRTGVVLGREGGMIKSLIVPFFFGAGGKIGEGTQPLPWIHITDLCEMIKWSIENPRVKGVLNGVAPDIVTNEEFMKVFARTMFRPALFPMPEFVVNLIFGKERGVLLTQGARIEPKRVKELGFKFNYPDAKSACKDVAKFF